MEFLLDVNASGAAKDYLIRRGHDIKLVSSEDIRMSDRRILKWAVKENRIIVTTDQDFEAMVWKESRNHAGILRLENIPRTERLSLLDSVLKNQEKELEKGAIVIATRHKVRIRHKL